MKQGKTITWSEIRRAQAERHARWEEVIGRKSYPQVDAAVKRAIREHRK